MLSHFASPSPNIGDTPFVIPDGVKGMVNYINFWENPLRHYYCNEKAYHFPNSFNCIRLSEIEALKMR